MSKITKLEVNTLINEDGEIIQESKSETYHIEVEPNYVKLYVQDIAKLKNIPKGQNSILLAFIAHMGYKNVIPAFKPIKQMIANELNCSVETVSKAVKVFKKKGLFIPVARGMYIADPQLFGKGKWSDIKQLRLTIEYNQDGTKKISSTMAEQLKL